MRRSFLVLAAIAAFAGPAWAADSAQLQLTLRDHRFEPAELKAPAGGPLEITLRNEDRTAEEFESRELKVEKVVAGGKSIVIRLRALQPGRYKFYGEFHEKTAQGVLVVEAP